MNLLKEMCSRCKRALHRMFCSGFHMKYLLAVGSIDEDNRAWIYCKKCGFYFGKAEYSSGKDAT